MKEIINLEKLAQETNGANEEYPVNSNRAGTNYIEKKEVPKVFIPDTSKYIGLNRYEVMEFIVKEYGAKYRVADWNDEKYFLENRDKVPEELRDRHYYNFRGSKNQHGGYGIFLLNWSGFELKRYDPGEKKWDEHDSVFLFER